MSSKGYKINSCQICLSRANRSRSNGELPGFPFEEIELCDEG
jgi:hypothetical protein